MFDCIGL